MFYCPNYDFYAFDIFIEYDADKSTWLDYESFVDVMKNSGIESYAKEIFRGTLKQCLDFDVEFVTTLPSQFGLPPLTTENISEGVVIKPLVPFTDEKGNRWILKKKSEAFKEVTAPKAPPVGGKGGVLHAEMICYVTENRLEAVKSKMQEDFINDRKHIGTAVKNLIEDVLKDFMNEKEHVWEDPEISEVERNSVVRQINKACSELVLDYIKKNKTT